MKIKGERRMLGKMMSWENVVKQILKRKRTKMGSSIK